MTKKKIIIWLIVVIIIAGISWSFFGKKSQAEYTTEAVKRGDLVQTVSEVGSVKAAKELNLNFNSVGKLNKILVKVGDLVIKDQILAELDYSSLLIKQREAQSSLDVARATLNKLLAGATASDIAVYSSQVNQAKSSYAAALTDKDKAEKTLNESVNQAQKKVNDLNAVNNVYKQAVDNNRNYLLNAIEAKIFAANNALDYVSRIINDSTFSDSFSVKNSVYEVSTNNNYDQASTLKITANNGLNQAKIETSDANLATAEESSLNYLNKTIQTLNSCFSALESSIVSSSLSQTQLDTFKSNINTHLSTINTAVSAIQTADYNYQNSLTNWSDAKTTAQNSLDSALVAREQQLATAQARISAAKEAWDVAQQQLNKIKAPTRTEDLDLARAQVSQAMSNLDLTKQQINDNKILAPINGRIANINYEIGEQVSGTKPMITLLTENNFEVEVDISESDISKIKLNDPVALTFDAFGENRKFNAALYFVDPASTIISDVIYYKVKIRFTDDISTLSDIKSGMTVNAVITTNKKENVLIIPGRAVIDKNGAGKFVKILTDVKKNTVVEVPVAIGMSGNDGLVEVLSGDIKEGDKIVTFTKAAK
jgi:RND family efflux transporter MFP subunit